MFSNVNSQPGFIRSDLYDSGGKSIKSMFKKVENQQENCMLWNYLCVFS